MTNLVLVVTPAMAVELVGYRDAAKERSKLQFVFKTDQKYVLAAAT
jgi:hypothetical protein